MWVNGATSDEASPGSDSRVSIPVGERARVRLRPGETLDRGTGEVRDVLGPAQTPWIGAVDDLTALWTKLPRLRRLSITAQRFELGELRLPALGR